MNNTITNKGQITDTVRRFIVAFAVNRYSLLAAMNFTCTYHPLDLIKEGFRSKDFAQGKRDSPPLKEEYVKHSSLYTLTCKSLLSFILLVSKLIFKQQQSPQPSRTEFSREAFGRSNSYNHRVH